MPPAASQSSELAVADPPVESSVREMDDSALAPRAGAVAESARLQHQRITDEQIRIALQTGRHSARSGALAVLAVASGVSWDASVRALKATASTTAWIIIMMALLGSGAWICARADRDGAPSRALRRLARIYNVQGVVVGLAWTFPLWLTSARAEPVVWTFLIAALAAVMCGGITSQSAYLPFAATFGGGISVGSAAALLHVGGSTNLIFATGMVILPVHVMFFARTANATIIENIRLRLVNERLRADDARLRHTAERLRADAERAQRAAETEREAAVRADQGKARVIAATSHDLRQPLHALVQYAAHLHRPLAPDEHRRTVARIEECVTALQGMLDAVMDYADVAAGQLRVNRRAVALLPLIQQVETRIRPMADEKGLRLSSMCDDVTITTDPALLERLLGNLVHNAVRYTNHGGVHLRVRVRATGVRLIVADSGIGIPPGERDRIFEEYYQIGNAARLAERGRGIGLSIVRDFARLLGCTIRVKSRMGVGSVFAVELPRPSVSDTGRAASPVPGADAGIHDADILRGVDVLLIENEALARDSLTLTLTALGCQVHAVATIEDAVQHVHECDALPQLLLTDYRLADGATGLDAIARIHALLRALDDGGFCLPAMVISGDTAPDVQHAVARAGYPLLRKPVTLQALVPAMEEALSAQRAGALPTLTTLDVTQ